MTCDSCAATIEKQLTVAGIVSKKASYKNHNAIVSFNPDEIASKQIIRLVNDTGHYEVEGFQEIKPAIDDKPHLVIIGGGSAAFAATIQAHELGARVTMINEGLPVGGTCVNVGCVPSKILIRAAEELHQSDTLKFPGIVKHGKLQSFKEVIKEKRKMVKTLQQEKYIGVVAEMDNFTLIKGRARIASPKSVSVNGETIAADAILVASGASPKIPPIPGLDEVDYLTNETAYELEDLPERLIVLGGNYIGLENAQMFARFGSKVTVVELLPQILPTESPELVEELQKYLSAEGIEFLTNARTSRVYREGDEIVLEMNIEGKERKLRGTHLLVATGRKANTGELGLEEIGAELTQQGFLKVDEYLQSNVAGIYGAGDVIGGFMFVYTAAYEGKIAVLNALSPVKQKVDYSALPWVIFTDPQVAGVGADEKQAAELGIDAEAAVLPLSYIPRSIAAKDTRGFIKLIRNKQTDELVGARILAPEGSELLMEIAMAIKFGIKVEQIKEMFHPYLTLSEGVKLAAITFSKKMSELSCCAT